MKVYVLTRWGKRVARSTRNPDTPQYKVIAHLDRTRAATADQIQSYTGMTSEETGAALSRLRRNKPPLVEEAG